MVNVGPKRTFGIARIGWAGLGAAALTLFGAPAFADVCPDPARIQDAGKVVQATSASVPAQFCSDGSFTKVSGQALIGQTAKRVGSGAYILPNYGSKGGVRIVGAYLKVK